MAGRNLDELGENLSWRDLWVLIRRWAKTPGTAFAESVHGEQWTVADRLLANVFDVLQVANWQRIGKKGATKPKPLPRPWDPKPKTFGSGAIPIDEIDDWMRSTVREE